MHISERIHKDPLELDFLVPLPNPLTFEDIPRIDESRKVWDLGMKQLQKIFFEHLANVDQDFYAKADKYREI